MGGTFLLAAANTGRHGGVDSLDNYDGAFDTLMQLGWRTAFLLKVSPMTACCCRCCAPRLMPDARTG